MPRNYYWDRIIAVYEWFKYELLLLMFVIWMTENYNAYNKRNANTSPINPMEMMNMIIAIWCV
jgi:hypothetical protein